MWLEGGCCHGQSPFGMQSSPAGLFAPSVFLKFVAGNKNWMGKLTSSVDRLDDFAEGPSFLRVMSSQKIIPPSKKRETWHSDKTSCQENTIFSTKIHNFWRKNAESSQVLHLTVHFGAPQTKKKSSLIPKKNSRFFSPSHHVSTPEVPQLLSCKKVLGGLGCWCNHWGWLKKKWN